MKKIVIVTNCMIRGGVETALISMLKTIDVKKVNVTLLLLKRGGILEKKIPKTVKVNYVDELGDPKKYLKKLAIQGHPVCAFRKAWSFYCSVRAKNYWDENELLTEFLPILDCEYDVAIAYHAPGTLPVHYVLRNIKAKKKILWIHGDVEKTKTIGENYRKIYNQYDRIICVSKGAERVFLKHFPETKQKCLTVPNVIDTECIDSAISKLNDERYTICTVARLSPEKGIDLAIEACSELIKKYPYLKWCVCGGGSEEHELKKQISKLQLEEHFFLLGDQDNPYNYMACADVYVQPSIHEGYCMTIAEARYLRKPIVSTCTTGALEQLTNRVNGTIVGISAQDIAGAIDELLTDYALRKKYEQNLEQMFAVSDYERIMKAINF